MNDFPFVGSRITTDDSGNHTFPNLRHNQDRYQPNSYFSMSCKSLCMVGFCVGTLAVLIIGFGAVADQWKSAIGTIIIDLQACTLHIIMLCSPYVDYRWNQVSIKR